MKLYNFQKEGVKFLIENVHALLADDMGLGKTIQAITALNLLNPNKVVIVCPSAVKYQWLDNLTKFGGIWAIQVIEKASTKIKPAHVYIMSYNIMVGIKHKFQTEEIDCVIFDEAHYLKSKDSQRTQAAFGHMGLVRKAKYKWCLTGTPIENTPIDLYPMLAVLAPEVIYPSIDYYDFAKRYCGGRFNKRFRCFMANGATNKEELRGKLKSFMLRRTKEQVLKELPPLTHTVITLRLKEEYRVILGDAKVLETDQKYFFSELGVNASIRRKLAQEKIKECFGNIELDLESTKKILVYAHHQDVIAELVKVLKKYKPMTITGKDNAKTKYDKVTDFLSNDSRVLVGSITAMGTGTDRLQHASSVVHLIEWDYTPGKTDQAIDRLHRMGQKAPVFAKFYVIEDSLESKMIKTLLRKRGDAEFIQGDQ